MGANKHYRIVTLHLTPPKKVADHTNPKNNTDYVLLLLLAVLYLLVGVLLLTISESEYYTAITS